MIFLYDGTFEGFLSAVFDAFSAKDEVEIEKKEGWQPQLFADPVEVETVQEKAERVVNKLLSICGRRGFSAMIQIFLSLKRRRRKDNIDLKIKSTLTKIKLSLIFSYYIAPYSD